MVGFSGGKESICTLDIVCKVFGVVVPYHFYFMPTEFEINKDALKVLERYDLQDKLIRLPSRTALGSLKMSMFRPWSPEMYVAVKVPTDKEYQDFLRGETGIDLIATGHRRMDSLSRRRMFARMYDKGKIKNHIMPLASWSKWDVFAYLKRNKLPIPNSNGQATFDIALSCPVILYLHDAFPEDYNKIKAKFPFVEAFVRRREFYGVGDKYTKLGAVKQPNL